MSTCMSPYFCKLSAGERQIAVVKCMRVETVGFRESQMSQFDIQCLSKRIAK